MKYFTETRHVFNTSLPRSLPRSTKGFNADLQIVGKLYAPIEYKFQDKEESSISCSPSFVFCHGNGFPKELFEPMLDELYIYLKQKGIKINLILTFDAFHQGESGVLNESKLGDAYAWFDTARDIGLILHDLKTKITPLFFNKGPLIGVGHSMGGTTLLIASQLYPTLFSSIICLDAIIGPFHHSFVSGVAKFASLSMRRKDSWKSRSEALTSFQSNPFYKTWDPIALEKYVEFGLRDLPTFLYPNPKFTPGSVTLTTTKKQETITFLTANGQLKGHESKPYNNIMRLEPNYVFDTLIKTPIPVFLVVVKDGMLSKVFPYFQEKIKQLNDKDHISQVVWIDNVTHALPFENPKKVTECITPFIIKSCEKWMNDREKKIESDKEAFEVGISGFNKDYIEFFADLGKEKSKF